MRHIKPIHLITCLSLLMSLTGCMPALHSAAERGDTKTVVALLDQGTDVNARLGAATYSMFYSQDSTALHVAAREGHIEMARTLLDRGADVNARDIAGRTPLYWAALEGHLQVVRLLVERGARVGIANRMGNTPLESAMSRGHTSVVEFLKQAEVAEVKAVAGPMVTSLALPSPTIVGDVDRLPSVKVLPRRHAYAVVIGIEQYREKLPKADFAAGDAKLMGEYLTKVLGYPEENVVVRLNDKAAKTDLEKYFGEWLRNNVEPGGSVFIYYSGHGAPNPKTGEAYLVPYDGDPTFVDTTGYPLKRLYASLETLPAKEIIVVLDSCFSGAGGRSVLAKGARPMGIALETAAASTGKAVVLAASSGDQISSTYEEKGHGLLTYFFLKGLQGEGDLNKDGVIELEELYLYVKPQVQRIARKQYNTEQTPQLLASPDLLLKGGGRLIERMQ